MLRILFLANIDDQHGVDTLVKLRGAGRLEQWDPRTGAIAALPTALPPRATPAAEIELAPAGSALLVLDAKQTGRGGR